MPEVYEGIDDITGQGLANYGLWAKSSQPPNFVNIILLEHSHAHSLTYCLWSILAKKGYFYKTNRMNIYSRDWQTIAHGPYLDHV